MAVIQPFLEIPPYILEGLLSGKYTRFGGVIRETATGIVVKHLDEVAKPIQKQVTKVIPKQSKIINTLKKPEVITAIAIGTVIIGGVTWLVVDRKRKNEQKKALEIPKCVEDYNTSFCNYLKAGSKGKLDIDIINRLISDLNNIRENYDSGKISIDFLTEQFNTLVFSVYDYTRKLAEANSFELNELKEPMCVSATNTIIDLQNYLEVQRKIFEKVS